MILDDIVAARRADVAAAKRDVSVAVLEGSRLFAEPRRGFLHALKSASRGIVAEVKKASPSRGVIRNDFDPRWIASRYADSGAAAISVLTEERHFQGRPEYLQAVRESVSLPLLRKDFIFDEYQIVEARAWGADAVLLIVASLEDGELRKLLAFAKRLELDALVEVHDGEELQRALAVEAEFVGVNNRNLKTFETVLTTAVEVGADIPASVHRIAESGIHTRADIAFLESAGYTSFLIGESLMRAPDPGEALASLLQGDQRVF